MRHRQPGTAGVSPARARKFPIRFQAGETPAVPAKLRSLVAALLAVVLLSAPSSFACAPSPLGAIFVYTVHPTFPLQPFASGRFGILQPSYARSYLYVAYRYLVGSSFTPGEQRALTELWKERLEGGMPTEEELTKAWLDARHKVTPDNPAAAINVYRNREKPNEYESYLNCPKDAFDTAIATLNDRIAKYGADSEKVRTWLAAQDEVFSNCGGGSFIPVAIADDPDLLMRADRDYQRAAANFYSTNFDEARKEFEAIAADSKSPWQANATYLIARVLVRNASLGPAEQKQESLTQAEAQLQKILANKTLSSLHGASTRLLNLVRLRLHPAERLHELAQKLTSKTENPNLKQDLWDYTALLDSFLEEDQAKQPDKVRGEDLSEWIETFQASDDAARDRALARWHATRSSAWLIAALSKVDGQHPKAAELIAAALRVRDAEPAFASTRFHAVRLLTGAGKTAEARALLDQLLKTERAQFDTSSLNLLIGQRMLLANNLAEFLADATRVPAALSWDDNQLPAEGEELPAEYKPLQGKPFFDADAANALNQQFPLSVLAEAAKNTTLPLAPRRDLVQAAWVRAILLDDLKTADELAPVLSMLVPGLAPLLNDYLSATQPDDKKAAAIYAWLKFPGLKPVVDQGIGRETPLQQQDSLRDNWWCNSAYTAEQLGEGEDEGGPTSFTSAATTPPKFLSSAEVQKGSREWQSLRALGAAPNYLSKQVIQWATRSPNDSRVPEALHLAVRTTRYGCTDKDTGRWSKAAFDLLHRKYPNSSWAKKTPYWFKD